MHFILIEAHHPNACGMFFCHNSQPYQRDNSSGGSRGRGGRGSVFSRLGTSAGGGGLSQRAAGLRSKGEGWHKVTVSEPAGLVLVAVFKC